MCARLKSQNPNRSGSVRVRRIFRGLFALGFLLGCLFIRALRIPIVPVSTSVWFSGPFEESTDVLTVFFGFLFDFLLYALPIFIFGMTFLGTVIVPAAISAKGFTLGAALTALIRLEGTGAYFRRCLDYVPMSIFGVALLLCFAAKAFDSARHGACVLFGNEDVLCTQEFIRTYTVQFLFVFAALLGLSLLYCILHFLPVPIPG